MIRLASPADAISRFEELATMQRADFRSDAAALTMDQPPEAAALKAALRSQTPSFVASLEDEPAGYGSVRRWTETGNVVIQLLDVWAAPGSARTAVEEALFSRGVVVGLASAVLHDGFVEIDDVQVDPDWQRQGIASSLMALLFRRIRERSELPVRLHTEGHDPAGALTLYESLGFRVVARHHRMRTRPVQVTS